MVKSTSNTLELLAWQTKTTSAVAIKRNPVPLIAPLFSFSGARWWIPWSGGGRDSGPQDGLPDPHDQQGQDGLHPPPRSLRWLKDALGKQGAPVKDVAELSWYSFRVFMPDWAFQAHIPRDQRQYLGNWFKESTADVYRDQVLHNCTGEERHPWCSDSCTTSSLRWTGT